MKHKWPTLKARLQHQLKDELTALHQLKSVLPLSKQAQKLYDKLNPKDLKHQKDTKLYE